jgi:hypothetical protein
LVEPLKIGFIGIRMMDLSRFLNILSLNKFLVIELEREVEERLINKNLVRVRKFPKYPRERVEEALRELEELSPYIEKAIEESRHE